ncbi:MAG: hypothetical protein O2U62_03060 [Candidatus Bathyarchaeota archaeon]|nr:hypothetical protein [Candidatus Bathyarchaeota archaeon]
MACTEEDGVFSIQTFNLTKGFTKKRHKGIIGFLRRERRQREQQSERSRVTVALDRVNIEIRSGELFGLLGPTARAR